MLSRSCTYGRVYEIVRPSTIPRRCTNKPSSLRASEFRLYFPSRNFIVYQCISQCHSHAAAIQEVNKDQQDIAPVHDVRRAGSNNLFTTPSRRFIAFDQPQHVLEAEVEKESESQLSFGQLATQLKGEPFEQNRYGHKDDKKFINKLLKDKGPASHDWRAVLSELQEYHRARTTNEPRDSDKPDDAPSLLHTADFNTPDFAGNKRTQNLVRRVKPRLGNCSYFRLARDIPSPTLWSEENLAVYVEAVAESQRTQANVPWVEKPQLRRWSNIDDVFAALDDVFYRRSIQKFLSARACNTALRFFYDHGKMSKARSLFIQMEDLKIPIPAETYNILLRGSASQRDLYSFRFLLHRATLRGFKPNEATWGLFLEAIDSRTVRAVIVRKMAEMNMLDKLEIRRVVTAHMLYYEVDNHLGNGHDHDSFLDHMSNKYGVGWLSTSAGNRLLNEVAKRKSVTDSLSLLYGMKQAGFMPNENSMNTLLHHCLPLRRHELAIDILEAFRSHYGLHPGTSVYDTLFRQAWRSRLLNFSIVVWRHACICGAVSSSMRYHVFRSVLSSAPALGKWFRSSDMVEPKKLSRRGTFKKFAGRFLVGVDGPRGVHLYQAMDALNLNFRRRKYQWARRLLQSSLKNHRGCLLEGDLPQFLRQALTMDRTWAVQGLYKKDDWWEMFPRTMDVNVKKRSHFHFRKQKRFQFSGAYVRVDGILPLPLQKLDLDTRD